MTNRDRAEKWLTRYSREFGMGGDLDQAEDIDRLAALLDEVRGGEVRYDLRVDLETRPALG